jgi:hypothetical protein
MARVGNSFLKIICRVGSPSSESSDDVWNERYKNVHPEQPLRPLGFPLRRDSPRPNDGIVCFDGGMGPTLLAGPPRFMLERCFGRAANLLAKAVDDKPSEGQGTRSIIL